MVKNEDKIAALDWIHDHLLDDCETVEEVREAIVNETVRLKGLHALNVKTLYDVKDLKINAWSSARRGSWCLESVSGVQIIHLPTGICIEEEGARSQHMNRANALKTLNQELSKL